MRVVSGKLERIDEVDFDGRVRVVIAKSPRLILAALTVD